MKLIKNAAIGLCLIVAINVQAQEEKNNLKKTKIGENKENALRSERKKNEYKSEEWRQENPLISEKENKPFDKHNPGNAKGEKNSRKPKGKIQPPPPPPPPALPPAPPPPPPAKE